VLVHGVKTAPECGRNAAWRVVCFSVVSAVSGVTPGLTTARLGTIVVGIWGRAAIAWARDRSRHALVNSKLPFFDSKDVETTGLPDDAIAPIR
jgi:hypothetical protein